MATGMEMMFKSLQAFIPKDVWEKVVSNVEMIAAEAKHIRERLDTVAAQNVEILKMIYRLAEESNGTAAEDGHGAISGVVARDGAERESERYKPAISD